MQSTWEICVSHNGRHFFATHERSLAGKTEEDARCVADAIAKRFTKEDGYMVTLTKWTVTGERIGRL